MTIRTTAIWFNGISAPLPPKRKILQKKAGKKPRIPDPVYEGLNRVRLRMTTLPHRSTRPPKSTDALHHESLNAFHIKQHASAQHPVI